jgi:hypothetical protein
MKVTIRRSFQRSPSGQIRGEHWTVKMGETTGEGTTLRDAKMDARHNHVTNQLEVNRNDCTHLSVKS